jgi:quinol monooxygenase YgiN
MYELYKDAAAFDAHSNGPSTMRIREEAVGMMTKISGTKCALRE